MARVADAGSRRADHSLGGKQGTRRLTAPAIHDDEHGDERHSVEREHEGGASHRDQNTAEGGPDCTADVHGQRVERHRTGELGRRHEL